MKHIYILAYILLISCANKPENIEVALPVAIENQGVLKKFNYEDVAKYTMSSIMLQSPSIMTVYKDNDVYIVSYIRKSDQKKFIYKVKFNDDNVVWANFDGRWRDGKDDEKIKFEEVGNTLKIHTIYSDGSSATEEFNH